MVYYRQDRRWKNETQTEDTTFDEALPSAGVLDAIMVNVRVKNASAHYDRPKTNIWDHITDIVLKADGIEAPIDAWGQSVLASYAIEYGRLPPGFLDTMASNYQTLSYPILFGRRFKDGKYGFDLSKHGEVRLQVKNDYALADLSATQNIWYDVDLWFREAATPPPNYIGLNQVSSHTWTGNAQEHKYIVPQKYKVRRIFLGCECYRTAATSTQADNAHHTLRYLTYSYKTGTAILRNRDDLFRTDQDILWGYPDYVEVEKNCSPRTGYSEDMGIDRPIVFQATPAYSADPGADIPLVVGTFSLRFVRWRRATANHQARCRAGGYGILDHLCIHEDQPDDETGYLDPKEQADVVVTVENSAADGDNGITRFITQVLRPN